MSILPSLSPISATGSLPVGYINPPSNTLLPKAGLIGLSAIAIPLLGVTAIGALGGNEWRDGLLAKIGGNRTTNPSPTPRNNDDLDSLPQGLYEALRNDNVWFRPNEQSYTVEQLKQLRFYPNDDAARADGWVISNGITVITYYKSVRPVVNGVAGNPIGFGGSSNPSGLSGGKETPSSQGLANPNNVLTPNLSSAIGWGDSKAINGSAALGIGATSPTSPKLSPSPNALGSGIAPSTAPPTPPRRQNEQETKKPETEADKERLRQEDLKREADRLLAAINGGNASITSQIAGLGAIIGTINSNTQPDAQRLNAKNGSCDALNSPSCTKGVEDRIKNPINEKVDSVATKATAIVSGLDFLKNLTENSFKFISRIYNNQFIHSSLSFMTTMTTIHNAAMLSRDVAETLGTVVDNSINLSGNKLKDAEGNDINFTSWIGSNIRAIIIQLIGADKYVQLALQWQKANTIYHSAMAVVNTTQSMLDPLSSAVEYGMENVSKIGNGLREDGVVSENSYPAMDETIRARRVNRFERLNDTLEGAENISSNLSSITGSAVSVKEDFRQLREDQKQLRDQAANFNAVDEQARAEIKASLPTQITPINLTPAPEEETP